VAKDTRIAFRASEEMKRRLQSASKKVKLNETALAEAAVEAAVEYIEKHGGIWLPLQVVPRPAADFPEAGAKRIAADAGGLSTGSTRYSVNEHEPAPRFTEEPPAGRTPRSKTLPPGSKR
jgi:hypothetical protein